MWTDEQTFRLILIVGALILFPIAIYHRIRSLSTRERLDGWQEGWFILLTLRPIGIAGILGLVAYMIHPMWMSWSSIPLPPSLRWMGLGLAVIGGAMLVWTMHVLGKNLTDTVVTRREHTLVTAGPYRWVRHPFYDSALLIMLGNGLAAANWFILVTGMLMFSILVLRTRIEERKLLERFGESYRAYMQQTPRFIPRPRRSSS